MSDKKEIDNRTEEARWQTSREAARKQRWIGVGIAIIVVLLILFIILGVTGGLGFSNALANTTDTIVNKTVFSSILAGIGIGIALITPVFVLVYGHVNDNLEVEKRENGKLRNEISQLKEKIPNPPAKTASGAAECPCGGNDCLTCGGHEEETYQIITDLLKGKDVVKDIDELHDGVAPKFRSILQLIRDNKTKLKSLINDDSERGKKAKKALDHLKHLAHDAKSDHRDIVHEIESIY